MSFFSARFHAVTHAIGSAAHAVGSAAHAVGSVAHAAEAPLERVAHVALSPVILATEAPVHAAAWVAHRALPHATWASRLDRATSHELAATEHQAIMVGSVGAALGAGIATLDPGALVKGSTSAVALLAAAAAGPAHPAQLQAQLPAQHPAQHPAQLPAQVLTPTRHNLAVRVWHYFMTREWES